MLNARNRQFVTGQCLNRIVHFLFRLIHHGNGNTIRAGTSRTADAVHIIFRLYRHFIVHHKRQFGNIQTARRHIGRHQNAQAACFKLTQHIQPRLLRFIAVNCTDRQPTPRQITRHLVGRLLGFAEHNHLLHTQIHNQTLQQIALAVCIDRNHMLLHIGVGGVLRRHFHHFGRVHEILRQFTDGRSKRGREKQRLARARQHLHDVADIVDKAHIQHAVGLVQHHDFHFVQHNIFLFDMVEQAPNGCHDDFAACTQLRRLLIHVHTAEQYRVAQRQVFDIALGILVDLVSQFSRWR